MKYARLISGEDYGFTIESYMYPPEFELCDGLGSPVKGVRIGQQKRKAFGFTWQTKVGTDQDPDAGYIIHVVWNATAKPAEKSHETMNDLQLGVRYRACEHCRPEGCGGGRV